jgi:hypothetical protein
VDERDDRAHPLTPQARDERVAARTSNRAKPTPR